MSEFLFKTLSTPSNGRRISKAAIHLLSDYVSDQELLHDLDLALTEACANVVRHAYPEKQGELEVVLGIEPGSHVELRIADWGPGLDPDEVCYDAPEPTAEGGRGFFLMKNLSDELRIEAVNGKNTIFIRKYIRKEQWKGSK
ncbi:MAG: serine/threonine-protein kinase RsbW [Desulfovibrionales bacterium]|nr:serine/threonine-protein kinase RsbW [Desulfovibrionales bacterium]